MTHAAIHSTPARSPQVPLALALGPVALETNLLLAPIAGYCDLAFRTVVREASRASGFRAGVGLACTDLLSPQGLLRGTATSLDLAKTNDFDKPVGMQLYGADPELMAEGARWAVEHGATVVDINMGCPVDKVTKKDGGSKLLTDLSRAVGIARRVVEELARCPLSLDEWSRRLGAARLMVQGAPRAAHELAGLDPSIRIPVPLTCKMRLCWSTSDYHAGLACSPHLARMLADVGVVGVTVHGRTTEMKFAGDCIRPGIARVVDAVNGAIPIVGNGDVRTHEDAARMLAETGCQGVMIGRGALAAPWLFREAWHHLRTGEHPTPAGEAEKIALIRRYFALMREQRDDLYAMSQMRKRISWFSKKLVVWDPSIRKFIGCKPLKEAVRLARGPDDVLAALATFESGGLRSLPGQDSENEELAGA